MTFAENLHPTLKAIWSPPVEEKGLDSFAAEESTLSYNCKMQNIRRDTCPHCGLSFSKKDIVKIDYDSTHEDIYGWHFAHKCGAKLLVIND